MNIFVCFCSRKDVYSRLCSWNEIQALLGSGMWKRWRQGRGLGSLEAQQNQGLEQGLAKTEAVVDERVAVDQRAAELAVERGRCLVAVTDLRLEYCPSLFRCLWESGGRRWVEE